MSLAVLPTPFVVSRRVPVRPVVVSPTVLPRPPTVGERFFALAICARNKKRFFVEEVGSRVDLWCAWEKERHETYQCHPLC